MQGDFAPLRSDPVTPSRQPAASPRLVTGLALAAEPTHSITSSTGFVGFMSQLRAAGDSVRADRADRADRRARSITEQGCRQTEHHRQRSDDGDPRWHVSQR